MTKEVVKKILVEIYNNEGPQDKGYFGKSEIDQYSSTRFIKIKQPSKHIIVGHQRPASYARRAVGDPTMYAIWEILDTVTLNLPSRAKVFESTGIML